MTKSLHFFLHLITNIIITHYNIGTCCLCETILNLNRVVRFLLLSARNYRTGAIRHMAMQPMLAMLLCGIHSTKAFFFSRAGVCSNVGITCHDARQGVSPRFGKFANDLTVNW